MPWGSSPSLQTSTPVEETGHMFPEIESSLSYTTLENNYISQISNLQCYATFRALKNENPEL
jgi:hypothetical protein